MAEILPMSPRNVAGSGANELERRIHSLSSKFYDEAAARRFKNMDDPALYMGPYKINSDGVGRFIVTRNGEPVCEVEQSFRKMQQRIAYFSEKLARLELTQHKGQVRAFPVSALD